MQREIKFRAWDGRDKLMSEVVSVADLISSLPEQLLGHHPWSHVIWLEYTGLKDNTKWEQLTKTEQKAWLAQGKTKEEWDGKEIYEGDIVRIWDYGFKNEDEDSEFGLFQDMGTDKVTMERFPRYWLENESFGYEGEDLINPDNCEVIGDIYRNADLLEDML